MVELNREIVSQSISYLLAQVDYDIWKSYAYQYETDKTFDDLADEFIAHYTQAQPAERK